MINNSKKTKTTPITHPISIAGKSLTPFFIIMMADKGKNVKNPNKFLNVKMFKSPSKSKSPSSKPSNPNIAVRFNRVNIIDAGISM